MGEGTLRNRSLRDTTLRGMTEGRDTEEQQKKKNCDRSEEQDVGSGTEGLDRTLKDRMRHKEKGCWGQD